MSPHEFHGLVADVAHFLANLQRRFTLLEDHGAIQMKRRAGRVH